MVDPDNEERLLKIPHSIVEDIRAEALRDAVEAVEALPRTEPQGLFVWYEDTIAAIKGVQP